MRLLVTGGAGFIGSTIVRAALEEGLEVRVLDWLDPEVHPTRPRFDPRVDLQVGNVADAAIVGRALEGVDAVCHQSAKVGLGVSFADAPDYVRDNELATAVLLAGMERAGIDALVLASSMVVYGEGAYRDPRGELVRPGPRTAADLSAGIFDPRSPRTGELLESELVSEDAPVDPRNVYASTKLGQEYLASAWARSTGSRAIALRYHNVYGPGMPRNTPYAGVASLFRSALARGVAPQVFEDGAQRRSFVHVRDIAGANLAALSAVTATDAPAEPDASSPGGGTQPGTLRAYNVGANEVHTIGDVAAALSRHTGGPAPVITGEYRLGDVRHITASSARIHRELGWSPAVTFDDGMREFATAPMRGQDEQRGQD